VNQNLQWSVFTKPWRATPMDELGELVAHMGFDAVELPVRPGYQVVPDEAAMGLKAAVERLAAEGIAVASVASSADESMFSACANAGVDVIRIMVPSSTRGYVETGDEIARELDAISVRAARYGVRVGIQPHHDDYIADSSELHALLLDRDPALIGAIWDAAHDALARKRPEHGLDLLWPWLLMVNLKSARYQWQEPLSRAGDAVWEPVFTPATEGMAEWGRALGHLAQRSWSGPICLTAEYTDESDLVAKVTADLAHAKQLLAGVERAKVAQ
jgi:sugar phosphate isomerase/epimerase